MPYMALQLSTYEFGKAAYVAAVTAVTARSASSTISVREPSAAHNAGGGAGRARSVSAGPVSGTLVGGLAHAGTEASRGHVDGHVGPVAGTVIGGLAGGLSKLATLPLDLCKKRMQVRLEQARKHACKQTCAKGHAASLDQAHACLLSLKRPGTCR